jgi:cytoskeletal protein RodZ
MTDPGLTNRLRQHSRRSGLMVGVTMALTIAICIVGFIWVFAQLEPYVSDFVHRDPATAEQPSQRPRQEPDTNGGSSNDQADENADAEPTKKPPTPTPKPKATSTTTAFNPDYQTSYDSINLRAGPSTETDVVTTLTAQQPLQYLGDKQESDDPSRDEMDPGQSWLKFRTEDGEVGWVREFDVGPYSP